MAEPSILLQHLVIAGLAPIPGIIVGWALNRRLKSIEIKVNGRMERLQQHIEKLEAEAEEASRPQSPQKRGSTPTE